MSNLEAENLEAVIKRLIPVIIKYRDMHLTEADTKAWLISPLLKALGWHPDNPETVRYEFKANLQCNPVDYGLIACGKILLIVEAKRLGENLDRAVAQLFGNMGVAGGVHWGVLTDGDEYRVYKAMGDGNAMQKLFFQISISDEQDCTVVNKLTLLSRLNMERSSPKIDIEWDAEIAVRTLQEMLDRADEGLVKLIRERAPLQNAQTLKRLEVSDRIDATALEQGGTDLDISAEPKKRTRKGYDVFTELLANPIKREDLIKGMVKEGFSRSTAESYVNWSRRSITEESVRGVIENPFDFETTLYKDKEGIRWICKVGEIPQEYSRVKEK